MADRESTTGTPRWVKVFGLIAVVVVLLFILLMFIRGSGGRGHTPTRHFGDQAPPSSVVGTRWLRCPRTAGAHPPMTMPPRLRKLALTAHVTCSVGWLGTVVVFLALAIVGVTSKDGPTVRGAYLVMEPAAWFVLVPLAFASLLTGTVMSLGTTWGLFRHYWVVFKLLITIFSTIVLLIYMGTFGHMAGVAADPRADLAVVRNASPILHAALALLVLLVATVLAVYKPRGMTPYGQRKQREPRAV